MSLKDQETFHPEDQEPWRWWLTENHKTKKSIWVIFYKLSSGKQKLNWGNAVDEALCFGWIDSTKKTLDEERYIQYFSKRKPTSTWSRTNKEKVDQLISTGKMMPAGLNRIEEAKDNGSWTFLDDIEALIIPTDLTAALQAQKGAEEFFLALSKSDKKILLYWVISAKRPATREKRISEIVVNAKQGLKPKQFR
jgi:uncharacterized protein YdeI (YjbR/CyaY-like superfamily)